MSVIFGNGKESLSQSHYREIVQFMKINDDSYFLFSKHDNLLWNEVGARSIDLNYVE